MSEQSERTMSTVGYPAPRARRLRASRCASDMPWLGDTCGLVEAFRTGERTPTEELEAVLGAIERQRLAAVPFLDEEGARAAAAAADVGLPFGGVPIGIKELELVEGWPATEASLVLADKVAGHTSTQVERLEAAGAVKVGQTTASEFGGLNVSVSRLHGVTHNPWQQGRTAGGSSAGSAAAVAGGLLPIASGGDGGGSIRIPAGFCGLVGMKGTAGRIPRGPRTPIAPLTVVLGCLARSVRDVARWYDVCAGHDSRDPYSLPEVDGWEARPRDGPRPRCGAGRPSSPLTWARRSSTRASRSGCGRPARRWPRTPACGWSTSTCSCRASATSGRCPTWPSCGGTWATAGRSARTT